MLTAQRPPRDQRGPFPLADLLFLLACCAVFLDWWTTDGVPAATAAYLGIFVAVVAVGSAWFRWRTGRTRRSRIPPGPFPWRRWCKDSLSSALLVAVLAAVRLDPRGIVLAASLVFGGGTAMWLGKWLWANRHHAARGPEDRARP